MIIWRGWGVATLLAVLGIPAGLGLWSALGLGDAVLPAFVGAGLGLGAVGTFFLGRWLNELRPQARLEGWRRRRRAELDQHVAAGTFHLGTGHPAPRSLAEARAQAEALLQAELATVGGAG
ncbi:transcriptional accessory protein, partial [Desertihabitans aurantiacus]|uniref:transcriptional accessory protein n=1 Tax=Desertihabitans aurantiacus TaxID=2282477 RepID=UPI00130033D3